MISRPARPRGYRAHLLPLEPRMMFDAAAAVTAQGMIADAGPGDTHAALPDAHGTGDPLPHTAPVTDDAAPSLGFSDTRIPVTADPARDGEGHRAAAGPDRHDNAALPAMLPVDTVEAPPAREIIFIDTSVADYRQLAAEWTDRGEVVLIDGTRDGIDQVRNALAGRSDIGAIHIVSHGAEGLFWLGTTRVDAAAITGDLAASLAAIGRSLNPGGDILIYGCDFAEGTDGAHALAAFAQATHADVAASTDVTGFAARGGDWTLEARRGSVEARALSSADWVHTLDPNTPVPISVTADSLTVTDGSGTVVVTGTSGYGSDARSPDVGVGSVAVWANAATFQGHAVDLRATVVALTSGDAIRFNRPTGGGTSGDDPTFLLRDLTTGSTPATVQIRWELVDHTTGQPLAADVRFTIADIDGIGGNPNTRETVTASTTDLAYFTRERISDINFTSSLNAITASGTQNENTTAGQPLAPESAATFDWSTVSSFTLTYTLVPNAQTTQAQFYHDGDADFVYTDPVYVSVPRLDLDRDDSTAAGNDAHFTFTENGPGVPVVDGDIVVSNPMDINSITGASVTLNNYHAGDTFTVGTLPGTITASIGAVSGGKLVVTLSGLGSEADYTAALKAIRFANISDTPDPAQRLIDVSFSNDTLTSAVATSRIDVVPVNDAPTAVNDSASTPEDTPVTVTVLGNDTDGDGDALTVTAASALHGSVVRNADGTLTYTPDANYNGSDTISYTISDGHGGTASAVVAVRVIAQRDTPVNTVPPGQTVAEDGTVIFSAANGNAISIANPDGGQQSVTLTATHGTFTLSGTAGLTFIAGDGTDDATMTFSGTIAAINAALDGGSFKTSADYHGPADLSVTTRRIPVEGEDFQNAGAERPQISPGTSFIFDQDAVPGWLTTATDRKIEVWSNGYKGVPAYAGNQFFEINATQAASLYQEFRSTAGSPISVGFAHRGRGGVDTMRLTATDLGADGLFGTADDVILFQHDYTDGNTAWGAYSGQVTTAATGNLIRLDFSSVSTATGDPTVGNFLDAVTVTQNSVSPQDIDSIAITVTPVADIVPDTVTTPEDTAVVIMPLANDTFADPARAITAIDGMAIVAGGPAITVANGRVALDGANRLTFTPDADYNGTTNFTYTVTAGGSTETATETVVITPVNDAPVANGTLADRTALDGAPVSYATAPGFRDVEGDTLTYSATGLPAGLSIDPVTGVISGSVDRSASQVAGGHYSVVVTARDGGATPATQQFAIDVANPGPIAIDDARTTHVDTPATIAVLANDSDPDGDPLSVTGAAAATGSVVVLADGTLRYTPPAGFIGRDTVTYTITDGQGGTATAVVTIDVTNTPPMHDQVAGVAASDGQAISLPVGARFSDADGDPLTFSATGLPPGLSIDPATGLITGTIARSASQANGGAYTATIIADDGHGGSSTATLAWTIGNPAPAARDDTATTAEDTPVVIAPLANDTDPDGDPLMVVAAGAGHGIVVINPDGTLTYTPEPDYNGTDTISYVISDGDGGTSSATVTVTVTPVNDAPTSTGLPPRTTGDAATVSVPVASAFADIDGDRLTYSAAGLPAGLAIDPATGVISGAIAPGSVYGGPAGDGRYHAIVTATDPSGSHADAAFDWTVAQVAPMAADDRATTAEDTPVTIPVLANDTDADGDPLTIVDAVATHGTVTIVGGELVFTPDADFNGDATVTYTVADPSGNRATATVAVTVMPVNDAPVARPLPAAEARDAATITLAVGGFFTDPDGDPLRFTASGLPAGLSIDPVTGTIAGTVDRNASQVPGGLYHVVVTATDPSGARADSAFDWTIVNPAPVAANDAATTAEDSTTVIAVLANDTDPDGDPLTVVTATAGHGIVTINPDGTLAYTPDADFNGTDAILYTVSDGNGGTASASVLVTVTPVNDAPVATPDRATTAEDTPVVIPVLANDRDVDGDPLAVLDAAALHGSVAINPDGTIVYTPAADFNGEDVVTYRIGDGHGGTAAATVTVTVTPVNDAPTARADIARTAEDTPVVIAVLANDTDVDGDRLIVTSAGAIHGTVAINADGTLTYTPDADYNGADTITYGIADGHGGTATGTVTVTVDPVNDAPIAQAPIAPAQAGSDGAPVAIDTAPWFRDADGEPLIYAATGLPAGLSIDPTTGAIRGTIDRSASQVGGGAYAIVVTATDAGGAAATATFTLTVTNPAPMATDDVARTSEDTGVVIPVLANDRDPDGDPLTVIAAVATNGTATVNPDGTVTYLPGANFAGTDTIRYTVSDGEGGTATAIVTIVVDPVNDAPIIAGRDPIDAVGGRPGRIDVLSGISDADGDQLTITAATSVNGVVTVNRDGTLTFTPALGFVGTTTIAYTVADGQGGFTTGTLVIRVADGRGADIEQLLRIGQVSFRDPSPMLATITLADGLVRNPLSLLATAEHLRSLGTTTIGDHPVGDAVEAIRSLRGTGIDPDRPITAEVARLDALRDQRDGGDRLFDHRWGDFLVKGLTGFSAAADRDAGIMVESVVRGGAIYLEVRDTATDGARAPIRAVDVRLAAGGRPPEWLHVDARGLAIIERGADMDELHLLVRVTRSDGRTSTTPIVIQGATGEVELDRHAARHGAAPRLDATLATPTAAIAADAVRLANTFAGTAK